MGISAQMGMSADSEDACIAYQLFLEVGPVAVCGTMSLRANKPQQGLAWVAKAEVGTWQCWRLVFSANTQSQGGHVAC